MFPLFYVDDCLVFNPYNDKIYQVCAFLQEYSKIENDGYLNKYILIELYCSPDGSIHLSQPYLTQMILNMIPGMEKSITKPTPAVKPPLAKNEVSQAIKNDFNFR